MALVKCPDCGQKISDQASECPNCGCPVARKRKSGEVWIRMTPIRSKQKVTVKTAWRTLWKGHAGETAVIRLKRPVNVKITYRTGWVDWYAECTGRLDPSVATRYNIQIVEGVVKPGICLQQVDIIDSDRF